ncbi:MAG: hypothetical protein LUF28_08980 [Clostridiales bacterium]|nr:hypothetical protein [Clostridiales bacterium]
MEITTSLAPLKGELAGRKARLRGFFGVFDLKLDFRVVVFLFIDFLRILWDNKHNIAYKTPLRKEGQDAQAPYRAACPWLYMEQSAATRGMCRDRSSS